MSEAGVRATVRLEKWGRGDGVLTERRMMRAMEVDGFDVLVYTYRPGTVFPEHEHAQEKCDGVLEGVLRVTVGESVFDLTAGDRLYLPAGTRHAAAVVGEKVVLSLDGTRWDQPVKEGPWPIPDPSAMR